LQNRKAAGLVLFSSGSTGKPKAMLHDLDNLLLTYKRDYVKEINTLIFLTLDHIG
jgi:acyl-coenzyme A synthetase/AMP-(fatty) acid ligase